VKGLRVNHFWRPSDVEQWTKNISYWSVSFCLILILQLLVNVFPYIFRTRLKKKFWRPLSVWRKKCSASVKKRRHWKTCESENDAAPTLASQHCWQWRVMMVNNTFLLIVHSNFFTNKWQSIDGRNDQKNLLSFMPQIKLFWKFVALLLWCKFQSFRGKTIVNHGKIPSHRAYPSFYMGPGNTFFLLLICSVNVALELNFCSVGCWSHIPALS
jgi:hypothetical protein